MPHQKSLPGCCFAAVLLSYASCSIASVPVRPGEADVLTVYSSQPSPPSQNRRITVSDHASSQLLTGATATVPHALDSASPNRKVSVEKTTRKKAGDALTLQWNEAWYANLRVESAPLDLRAFIPHGILAFDLKVDSMARGGLGFRVNCGKECEHKVPYVLPARAIAGQGWRQVAFPVRCFVRDGDDFSGVTQPFSMDAGGSGAVTVSNVRFEKTGTPNASCPDYKTVSVTPAMLNESWSIDWWRPRHLKKLEEAKTRCSGPSACEIVFIGDSITEGWEKDGVNVWNKYYKSANALALGFGGDRTENVLWRLQHGEVDGINPKVAVLMFGTNNTGHRREDPQTTAAGIKRNIEELQRRMPAAKILLLAIFPRDEKADGQLRKINEQINQIISGFADGQTIFFLNINAQFLDANGTLSKDIMPDFLHPNEKGYEIWARAMQPGLQKLMQSK